MSALRDKVKVPSVVRNEIIKTRSNLQNFIQTIHITVQKHEQSYIINKQNGGGGRICLGSRRFTKNFKVDEALLNETRPLPQQLSPTLESVIMEN